MTVSVVVPFQPDGAERDRNWAWLRSRWEALHPDWELVEGTCTGRWNKPAAVNDGVDQVAGDRLVVCDADLAPDHLALLEAVASSDPWVVPFDPVYRLTDVATVRLLEAPPADAIPAEWEQDDLARNCYHGYPGGGVFVIDRDAFEAVGGMDERFFDWGEEDQSLGRALNTLIGPCHQIDAQLVHLWHPPQNKARQVPHASLELSHAYRQAEGDPAAMRVLVEEHAACRSRTY